METKSPIYKQAKQFADGVHAAVPGQWLAYNLSPSFNWDAAGLGEREMKDYVWELGKLGFGPSSGATAHPFSLADPFDSRARPQSGSSSRSAASTRTPTSRTYSPPHLRPTA